MHTSIFKSLSLWTVKIGLFIIPFIPLYIARDLFFPYITGKAFIFRLLIEIVFFVWVFLAIFYKEYRPQKNSLLIALGFFIAVVTLATIFAINPFRAFWSNFERMEGLMAYLHLFAYFLVLGHVFTKKDWLIFFNLFVLAGVYENGYGLTQRLGYLPSPQGGFRVDGTIGNPTYLAAYLTFIAGFCVFLWLNIKNKWARYFYAVVGLWSLITIYFTATRGAYVALLVGGLSAAILYLIFVKAETDKEKLYKKIAAVALVVIIIVPIGIKLLQNSYFVKSSPVISRLASISLADAQTRFTIWGMGWQGVKERPILGWGPEGYPVVFAKFYKPSLYAQEPWFDRSHNIVFDWLINAGILGLLAYFSVLLAAFYLIWRLYKQDKLSVQVFILFWVLLLIYLIQNIFVFDQIATYIGYFTVLAYTYSVSISEQKSKLAGEPVLDIKNNGPLVAVALLIPLAILVYFVNARPLLVNKNLLNALKVQNTGDFQSAYQSYEKAMSYNTLGNQETREQFARFAISVGALPQVDAEFKDTILRRAVEEAEEGVKDNILDPRSYLFLGSVYSRVGLLDQSIKVFKEALKLSPQKQQIYFELADVYIKKEEYAVAADILERAFNLAPKFDLARMNLVAAYILNGEQEKADQLLIEAYGTVNVTEKILVQVYSARKDYDRLVGVWEAFVKSDPGNLRYVRGLTGAYLLRGDEDSAVRTLENAISSIPSFRSEAEAFIGQIKRGNY